MVNKKVTFCHIFCLEILMALRINPRKCYKCICGFIIWYSKDSSDEFLKFVFFRQIWGGSKFHSNAKKQLITPFRTPIFRQKLIFFKFPNFCFRTPPGDATKPNYTRFLTIFTQERGFSQIADWKKSDDIFIYIGNPYI